MMGTVMYEKDGFSIKRFYGGADRGVCYQLNKGTSYIQVTEDEFHAFLKTIFKYALLDFLKSLKC